MNVTINTDASFCPKTKAAGYAVWIVCDVGRLKYSGILKNANTPTDAELQAIANALFLLKKSHLNNSAISNIYLNSDCIPALNAIGRKSKNSIGKYIHKITKSIICKGSDMSNFSKRHVKAHSGKSDSRSFVNEWCDNEAKSWMKKERMRRE